MLIILALPDFPASPYRGVTIVSSHYWIQLPHSLDLEMAQPNKNKAF